MKTTNGNGSQQLTPEPEPGPGKDRLWWIRHGDRILTMAAAIVQGSLAGHQKTGRAEDIVDMAREIVKKVTDRQKLG